MAMHGAAGCAACSTTAQRSFYTALAARPAVAAAQRAAFASTAAAAVPQPRAAARAAAAAAAARPVARAAAAADGPSISPSSSSPPRTPVCVPPAMLPAPASAAAIAEEAAWLAGALAFWLDEEWTPLAAHAAVGRAAGDALAAARRAGAAEAGDVLHALVNGLLAAGPPLFRDTFTGPFDVANKAVELLMLRGGAEVCCVGPDDASRVARFDAFAAGGNDDGKGAVAAEGGRRP